MNDPILIETAASNQLLCRVGILMMETIQRVPLQHRPRWARAYNAVIDASGALTEILEIESGDKAPQPPTKIPEVW